MKNQKLIFTGPVGAGKTTAIAAISDVEPLTTDEVATDMTSSLKAATTVAMDYGIMNLGNNERLHLYGTPGQERFDFMWDILVEKGIGLVLLLNNSNPDPFQDMQFFLNSFEKFIGETSVVIGVTRLEETAKPSIQDYQAKLAAMNKKYPVFEVDARNKEDISMLVESLLYTLDPGLAS